MEKSVQVSELESRLSELSPAAKGLFYFLPNECWMTERTMARALNTHNRAIRAAKRDLERAGLINIIHEPNINNRPNPKHRILKVIPGGLHPIPPDYAWVLGARESVLSPLPEQVGERDSQLNEGASVPMNWELLKQYSPAEINLMQKLEQVELYMEIGFLVLPTHYPRFSLHGEVTCSCKDGRCRWIGKHPAVRSYKELNPTTYQRRRKWYLDRFRSDGDLNIGFKVFGYSVLDVDYRSWGAYSLEYLREVWPGLDETLSVASPNGEHLYCSSRNFNQSAGLIGAGLDIRSDKTNGFIVAPGSTHKSGKLYRWQIINDLEPIPEEWIEERARPRQKSVGNIVGRTPGRSKLPNEVYPGYWIPEHERNDTLFKWASRARGRGAGESRIYSLLITLFENHCEKSRSSEDEITYAELRRIAKSACRYPTNAHKLNSAKAA